MFGFLIGFASLVGLIAVIRSARRHRLGACGGSGWHGHQGCGHGGHGGWHGGHGGWHGGHGGHGGWKGGWKGRGGWRGGRRARMSWMLNRVFEELDTSPGQEKEIRKAADELVEKLYALRKEPGHARGEIARAMRGESMDETILGELFARQDESIREVQKEVAGFLGRVHLALDEEQRKRLASLIESAPGPFGWGGRWGGGAPPKSDEGPYRESAGEA